MVDEKCPGIRKVDLAVNRISTVAGHGPNYRGPAGDGNATSVSMNRPHGICVARDGALHW
ncbi:MAG: hypothetical protein R3C11_25000 [Planctomycetaceae bacterium]